ncbi:hypothetical protein JOD45_000176 [Scopulibacillus daqui]|uniref:TadE-like protein n=1 Tax=Scopulibacillus daqui TaxID=1469162 RepID=A0ABS2PVD6_9BACL|nr:hypothetical protein [Scopulibacillus daqui]
MSNDHKYITNFKRSLGDKLTTFEVLIYIAFFLLIFLPLTGPQFCYFDFYCFYSF